MMWQLLSLALMFVNYLSLGHASPADRPYGTFQSPAARVRPRFRFWLPDSSINTTIMMGDIKTSGDLGAGGVEFLPFYNYGGGTPVNDWSIYGFGTPAFQTVFRAALEAHRDNDLIMDFAMGPNQGQGVPAEANDPGLQWDLTTSSALVPSTGLFNEKIPGWGEYDLVAAVSAMVLSSTNDTIPPRGGMGPPYHYTTLVLKHDTLTEVTAHVSSSGVLNQQFPTAGNASYIIFAFYQRQTLAKILDPEKPNPKTIFDNGSYLVDHYSGRGAQTVTKFWEQSVLTNGVRELLSQVGNSGWEDSMELLSNVSWSPSLPARFQARWGYNLKQFLPLIIFGDNNRNIQSSAPGLFNCLLDTEDQGQGYINDYRVALVEGYQEYLKVFTNWTKSYLDLQHSSQVVYNLPMDMEASIPHEDVPECESLQFRDDIDAYRQFSGSAYIAGKPIVSIELGAVFGQAFRYTLNDLLFSMNRATSGGVNQYIIHGQDYSGNYANTTWPGYVAFGYEVSEQYSDKQPDWLHGLEGVLRYMGRTMWVQQQGVPRIDVAFYNRQSATDPIVHTLYTSNDLQDKGWTYAYLSPDNFNLSQATATNGILAPSGPAFKAIVVENYQNMTLDAVNRLSNYASKGVTILLSGGTPGYYASGSTSDEATVLAAVSKPVMAKNVYGVAKGEAASMLSSLGLSPRVVVATSGTWITTYREDSSTGIDYARVFCDTLAASGTLTVPTTKKPYLFNSWTGERTPILQYRVSSNTTIIPLSLAGNETAIIAFAAQALEGVPSIPRFNIVDLTSDVLGYNYSDTTSITLKVPATFAPGHATLSSGSKVVVSGTDVPSAIPLTKWTLTAEQWKAPANMSDAITIAVKHNTTHELTSLISWTKIPGLINASGLGYYSTNFTWPSKSSSEHSLGAYIYFSDILHAITLYINGEQIPQIDYTNAIVDISPYLRTGSNTVLVVVPTTMWNYIRSILPTIRNSGAIARFPGGPFGSGPGMSDNGLVGTATLIPFKTVEIRE